LLFICTLQQLCQRLNTYEPDNNTDMKNVIEDITLTSYIHKVLKQVHPDMSITAYSLDELDILGRIVIAKIMKVCNNMAIHTPAKTLSSRDISTAVRITFPGELAKRAIFEGTGAVAKYTSTAKDAKGGKKVRRQHMAHLVLSVARIERAMMLTSLLKRRASTASVFLSAVVEYTFAEILDLAGNTAKDRKKSRISRRDIMFAIRRDEELNKMFDDVILAGGIVPELEISK